MRVTRLGRTALVSLAVLASSGWALGNPAEHLRALLEIGPRESGTPGNARARAYLAAQFRALGYEAREEAFSYERFQDPGSTVRVGARTFEARALHGGAPQVLDAPIASVRGVGTPADFRAANVRGKIAVVARGGMLFRDKARNARVAGAAALLIVNTEDRVYRGAIGEAIGLPVLSVASSARSFLAGNASLSVRVARQTVRGANVVAHLPGAVPRVLFGGHHDSFLGSPGINDNASGIVAVLDVARRVRGTPTATRAWFALFDGEEDRFHGSRAFVKTHAALLPSMRGMFNLDMVGVAAETLAVGGSAGLVRLARTTFPGLGSFADGGLSDHESFMAAGVPSLFFFRGIDPNYHLPTDRTASPELITNSAATALKVAEALLAQRAD